MGVEKPGIGHLEMAQPAQNRLFGDFVRGVLPVLSAFDEERAARIGGVVEESVIAQPPAGAVAAVDHDVLRKPERLRQREPFALAAGHRQRRARVRH